MSNTTPAPRPTLEQWMQARHGQLLVASFVLAILCAVLPVWQLIGAFKEKPANMPLAVWGGALALVFLFAGMYLRLAEQGGPSTVNYRVLALGVGGLVGLATFVMGVWLPMDPWASFFVPTTADPLSPDRTPTPLLTLWKANWWRLLLTAFAVIAGLVLMLMSLLLARAVERSNASLRRLLYCYNAVLTGLLLFFVLGLLNVLAYVRLFPFTLFDKQIDWTPSQMYTLAPRSVALLENELPGSIDIIALMPSELRATEEVRQLYENAKRHKKDMTFHHIPLTRETAREFRDEFSKYRRYFAGEIPQHLAVRGAIGMVVAYTRPDGTKDAVGIPFGDLTQKAAPTGRDDPSEGASDRFVFAGENQMMRALRKMLDKTPAKVVFTTGHGEMSVSDLDRGSLNGLGSLRERLDKLGSYEIKDVDLTPQNLKPGALTDAEVVVIARPRRPFSEEESRKAINEYLNPTTTARKGKLILLLDGEPRGGRMPSSGLEDILTSNGVEVSDKRLLTARQVQPDVARAIPSEVDMPITRAFSGINSIVLSIDQARRVSPAAGAAAGRSKVEPLLTTDPEEGRVWEEANMTASAQEILQSFIKARDQNWVKSLRIDLPVAVAVSENNERVPMRGHVPVGDSVPRMVVFGGSSWVSNANLAMGGGNSAVDFFSSCVAWLRGKSDLGPDIAPAKERPEYSLKKKGFDQGSKYSRLVWLPLGLILLAVVALGGGIWVVRRR